MKLIEEKLKTILLKPGTRLFIQSVSINIVLHFVARAIRQLKRTEKKLKGSIIICRLCYSNAKGSLKILPGNFYQGTSKADDHPKKCLGKGLTKKTKRKNMLRNKSVKDHPSQ